VSSSTDPVRQPLAVCLEAGPCARGPTGARTCSPATGRPTQPGFSRTSEVLTHPSCAPGKREVNSHLAPLSHRTTRSYRPGLAGAIRRRTPRPVAGRVRRVMACAFASIADRGKRCAGPSLRLCRRRRRHLSLRISALSTEPLTCVRRAASTTSHATPAGRDGIERPRRFAMTHRFTIASHRSGVRQDHNTAEGTVECRGLADGGCAPGRLAV